MSNDELKMIPWQEPEAQPLTPLPYSIELGAAHGASQWNAAGGHPRLDVSVARSAK